MSGNSWRFAHITKHLYGTEWVVLEKVRPDGSAWKNFRVLPIDQPSTPLRKRAFYIAWNGERFAGGKEFNIMNDIVPGVLNDIKRSFLRLEAAI